MKTWTKGIVTGLLAGLVSLGSLPAVAGPYAPYIDRREMNQERRIYRGAQSGQVTPGEFRRLENQQGRIHAAEARMRADGRLDRYERARLNRMENRAGRDIYRYRHNNNYRPAKCGPVSMRTGWHR